MSPFSCPDPELNTIWRQFRSVGITDDLAIIEHLGFFLLLYHLPEPRARWWGIIKSSSVSELPRMLEEARKTLRHIAGLYVHDIVPAPPPSIAYHLIQLVMTTLEELFNTTPPPQLFNYCVIERLESMLAGGRYPTARHLAASMARMVGLKVNETLGDLACGSGGLLVAGADQKPHVTGVEVSPNWARLAWTNVTLHDLPEPKIFVGNAFNQFSEPKREPKFDVILMNPPFGETVDRALINRAGGIVPGDTMSSRSETLLTGYALKLLKRGGRMGVLLPSGTLFSTGTAEQGLRESLLQDYGLSSVISLPKDILQPYSSLQTHLVIGRKPQEQEKSSGAVWFYRIQYDGFTSGRNRQPDPEHNELPLLELSVLAQSPKPGVNVQQERARIAEARPLGSGETPEGFHFVLNGESSFDLYRLAKPNAAVAGLLAVIEPGAPREYIFARGYDSYSGSTEPTSVSLTFAESGRSPFDAKIDLEKAGQLTLSFDGHTGTITVGKSPITLEPYQPEQREKSVGIAVNLEGKMIAPPFVAENIDPLRKSLKDSIHVIPLKDTGQSLIGNLVLFRSGNISLVNLVGANERLVYLAEIEGGYLVLETENDVITRIHVTTATRTYRNDKRHRGIAVNSRGECFGVRVPTNEIQKQNLDLQPDTYLPKEIQIQEQRVPAELLGDIKLRHVNLDERIDRLLGIVELRPLTGLTLPSPIRDDIAPFGTLTAIQRTVWQRVADMNAPFQMHQVTHNLPSADVQRALDLFERMGCLVRVSIDGIVKYRRIQERDLPRPTLPP